jgi:hypothetical protein
VVINRRESIKIRFSKSPQSNPVTESSKKEHKVAGFICIEDEHSRQVYLRENLVSVYSLLLVLFVRRSVVHKHCLMYLYKKNILIKVIQIKYYFSINERERDGERKNIHGHEQKLLLCFPYKIMPIMSDKSLCTQS